MYSILVRLSAPIATNAFILSQTHIHDTETNGSYKYRLNSDSSSHFDFS